MSLMPYDIYLTLPSDMLPLKLSGNQPDVNVLFTRVSRGGLKGNKIVVYTCKVYGHDTLSTVYYNVTLNDTDKVIKSFITHLVKTGNHTTNMRVNIFRITLGSYT